MGSEDLLEIKQALNYFTTDQMDLLISGLISLEGSLTALNQPIPKTLGDLKSGLAGARQKQPDNPKNTITTKEAAELLKCSDRHVRHLATIGRINLLERGEVGRGRTNMYDAKSVSAYAVERQKRRRENDKS